MTQAMRHPVLLDPPQNQNHVVYKIYKMIMIYNKIKRKRKEPAKVLPFCKSKGHFLTKIFSLYVQQKCRQNVIFIVPDKTLFTNSTKHTFSKGLQPRDKNDKAFGISLTFTADKRNLLLEKHASTIPPSAIKGDEFMRSRQIELS